MNLSKRHKIMLFSLIIAILLAVYFFNFAKKRRIIHDQQTVITQLQGEESSIASDNEVMKSTIANGPDDKVKEDIARNDYSMAKPEDRIYFDNTDQ